MVVWVVNETREWAPLELSGDTMFVGLGNDRNVVLRRKVTEPIASLIPWQDRSNRPCCILMCRRQSRVRCNGLPILAGVRVLCDRDEIALGSGAEERFYYSHECKPQIVPFEEGPKPTYCARSKTRIAEGTPAVRCPSCGLWYIETEEMPAYSYCGEPCVGCGQATTMDYSWRPDPLPEPRGADPKPWERWRRPGAEKAAESRPPRVAAAKTDSR